MRREKEDYEKAAEEIRQDQSFPRRLWKVVAKTIRIRKRRDSGEISIITDLTVAESALQLLATGGDDSTAFSALESRSGRDTNDEKSIKSNYRSSHRTLQKAEDFESTPPGEAVTNVQILPKEAATNLKTPPKEAQPT